MTISVVIFFFGILVAGTATVWWIEKLSTKANAQEAIWRSLNKDNARHQEEIDKLKTDLAWALREVRVFEQAKVAGLKALLEAREEAADKIYDARERGVRAIRTAKDKGIKEVRVELSKVPEPALKTKVRVATVDADELEELKELAQKVLRGRR